MSGSNAPTINTFPSPATCGNNNGSITVSASGGSGNFTYSIDDIHYQTGNLFNGLAANAYHVSAKDDQNCTASIYIVIDLSNNIYVHTGNDTSICEGTSTTITASTNANNFS